ncbi:CD2 antigen cytoplasmic tail-binding protein [Salix suchowensis]|nr:CD2 antigen cytoplasmic tail-binding protein [Salix suchowensis]
MESKRKRSFLEEIEDDESDKSKQKKVRFPKGKKVKTGDETVDRSKAEEEGPSERKDPRLAAKERALLRNEITAQIFCEDTNDASAAEVAYEENENFVEDGILIEPFNLEKEKEEGYFDAEGNFVEYIIQNEIKDAWLDSIQVDPRYTGKNSMVRINEHDDKDDVPELSSKEIGAMKKRIANLLEPGETVLQALRRLKGRSKKSKEKMSTETQLLFDQLTEDANKLLNHGEYNVYYDKQEVFRREAEGYERLALARGEGMSISEARGDYDFSMEKDLSFGVIDRGATSNLGQCRDAYDMFGDDEDNAIAVASSDSSNLVPGTESNVAYQPSSDGLNAISGTGPLQNDYVYDETLGTLPPSLQAFKYYYNSSLGYYYDPSTRLFCQATSGQWPR